MQIRELLELCDQKKGQFLKVLYASYQEGEDQEVVVISMWFWKLLADKVLDAEIIDIEFTATCIEITIERPKEGRL